MENFQTEIHTARYLSAIIHPVIIGSIISTRNTFHPSLILQIPTDSFQNAFFKRSFRHPSQFPGDFRRINRITLVMSQTVFDKSDQIIVYPIYSQFPVSIQLAFFQGLPIFRLLFHQLADRTDRQAHNINILPFIMPANIIYFTRFPGLQHQVDCLTMVFNI